MEHGKGHRQGADPHLGVNIDGDAPAVIGNGYGTVGGDGHLDMGTEARHGFVNAVVHHFLHQMMQAPGIGGADVQSRPDAHGFQPFQYLNL